MEETESQNKDEDKPQQKAVRALFGAPEATVIATLFTVLGAISGALIKGYYDSRTSVEAEQLRAESALGLEKSRAEASIQLEDRKANAVILLEQQKFQAELILQAISAEDQKSAVKTLKFFAEAGLIPSYEAKILRLTEDEQGAAVPVLRPYKDPSSLPAAPTRPLPLENEN